MEILHTTVRSILTRTSGFLHDVSSHSLQPYRGCALGNSLCGVGCYVQHNIYVTQGRPWGSFVEVRDNAAEAYRRQYESEKAWARRRGGFGIFLSSSTEPFQPIERSAGITRSVLETMAELPPDFLILQTHSHHVLDCMDVYEPLSRVCDLRFHISVESDRDELPGLPRSASPVAKRIEACAELKSAGQRVVVTVSPLLPMDDPERFFAQLREVCDAVVIDHYVGGDGSADGSRTRKTLLPVAMEAINPLSVCLEYRDEIAAVARRYFPGKVGLNIEGFAGKYF